MIEPCDLAPWNEWHEVYAVNDFNNHPCFYFTSLAAAQYHGAATRVFGVSGAVMQNGTLIRLWDKFESGHPDQYWCAY